jgi:hypothetical protein
MLWNASAIKGYAIAASDGQLGTVSDFLFDDASWLIRWLVVDTGNWLSGRKVLLPPMVLGHPHPTEHEFPVRLTRQQVKDSPDINADQPVSRQMETHVYMTNSSLRLPEGLAGLHGRCVPAQRALPRSAAPARQRRRSRSRRGRWRPC